MKKKTVCITILVISLTFLLSGCLQVDVDIAIDEHYTATLSYRISLDVGAVDLQYRDALKRAVHNMGWYYQENHNFVVELLSDSDPYVMVMTKSIENSSFEQAFESLEGMLTNEDITIFMEVDMAFQSYQRQSRYIFNATADIPQIMRLSNTEELVPDLQEQLDEAMGKGEGSITLTMPASEIISSTNPVEMRYNQATMTVPLNYAGQTELGLTGVVNLLDDGTPGGSVDEIIEEQNKFREISIIICCAAFVILLIIIIVAMVKRRR